MLSQVFDCTHQPTFRLLEHANPSIAVATQHSANTARLVVMVDS